MELNFPMASFDYNVCIIGWNKIADCAVRFLSKQKITSIKIICGARQMTSVEAKSIQSEYASKANDQTAEYISINITNDVSGELLKLDLSSYVGLSFDSPIIFKKEHINLFKGRLVNEHGAPLPDGRGGGGFSWRIMENDRRGAVLFHLVDEGIDSGDIIYRRDFTFPNHCRYPKNYDQYQIKQTTLDLPLVLENLFNKQYWDTLNPEKQENRPSLYFPRIYTPINGWINWDWPATKIVSFILAFSYPYSGAKSTINGSEDIVGIFDAEVNDRCGSHHPFKSGIIHYIDDLNCWVCAGTESIVVKTEHMMHKRKIRVGDRFTSPTQRLEKSRSIRPKFNAEGYFE